MQISSNHGVAPFMQPTSQRPTSQNDATSTFDVKTPDTAQIDAIKSRYDPENISPREIDQMFDELTEAGHPIDRDLLMLSTKGERFQSHLVNVTNTNGESQFQRPDPTAKINLVEVIEYQMTLARRAGEDTSSQQSLLTFLTEHKPNSNIPSQSPVAGAAVQAALSGQRAQLHA